MPLAKAIYEIVAKDNTEKAWASAIGNAKKFGSNLTSFLLPTALSGAGFAAFIKSAVSAADAVGDAASRAAALASEMSRLKYIGEQSDVTFESLARGMKEYQKNIGEAGHGTTAAVDAFGALNLTAAQLKGLRLDEQLGIIAENFVTFVAEEDRARVASELFGKAGYELIPMLLKGKEGMAALAAEADRLGITLDDHATAAIDKTTKALDAFVKVASSQASNFFGTIVGDLLGYGDEVSDLEVKIENLTKRRDAYQRNAELKGKPGSADSIVSELNARIAAAQKWIETIKASAAAEQEQRRVSSQSASDAAAELAAYDDGLRKFLAAKKKASTDEEEWRQTSAHLKRWTSERREVAEWLHDLQGEYSDHYDALTAMGKSSADEIAARMVKNSEYLLSTTLANQEKAEDDFVEFVESLDSRFQGAAADIFYAGFEGRSQNVGEIFSQLIKRMMAEALAADLTSLLFGKKSKSGRTDPGLIESGIGAFLGLFGGGSGTATTGGNYDVPQFVPGGNFDVPGFANGGSFTVGGSGGTDSQMVNFLATPGEHVIVSPPNKMGGTVFSPVTHITIGANNAVSRAEVMAAVSQGNRVVMAQLADSRRRGTG